MEGVHDRGRYLPLGGQEAKAGGRQNPHIPYKGPETLPSQLPVASRAGDQCFTT